MPPISIHLNVLYSLPLKKTLKRVSSVFSIVVARSYS
nr:MAG TPA: hypothetical protein [Caudoviricetes sp.]